MLKTIIIFYCSYALLADAFYLPSSGWANRVIREWHGKWFPQEPGSPEDNNDVVEYDGRSASSNMMNSISHGIQMGIPSDKCDDAKTNLTIDWDNSPINYTCFEDKMSFLPNLDVRPILHCDHIPRYYSAQHICMSSAINYDDPLPTFGAHRPLWGKYGEYTFLPKQRWLHNLEHGAVVMLYHPCANKNEVLLLKKLVQNCLYRHIITPYTLLPSDWPLALITWGCRFMMSKVDPKLVVEFIRNAALMGPEFLSKDGQYDYGLIKHANIVSDEDDSILCPNF